MNPQEYIEAKKIKKLSKKELQNGKDVVKISGTKIPMPWNEVYARIAMGVSMEDLDVKYGNIRKIALWAVHDNIEFNPFLSDIVDDEIMQRRKFKEVGLESPIVAKTMLEIVNEYAPDVGKEVAKLSYNLVKKAQTIVNDDCTSKDLQNIASAVQTMTDTVEITKRHSNASNVNVGVNTPNGFTFVLDEEPKPVIDAEVDNG